MVELLKNLFGKAESVDIKKMLEFDENNPSIVILSSTCCNPMAIPGEKKLFANVNSALSKMQLQIEPQKLSILKAQSSMKSIETTHKDLVNKIMGIFQSKGIQGFPAVIINGKIAFYGGVPGEDEILAKIKDIIG